MNPFKRRTHIRSSWSWRCSCSSFPRELDLENGASQIPFSWTSPSSLSPSNGPYNCDDLNLTFINVTSIMSSCEAAHVFVRDTLIRQVYLLRLPAMYFLRAVRGLGPSAKLRLHFDGGGKRGSKNSKVPQMPTSMKSPSHTMKSRWHGSVSTRSGVSEWALLLSRP